MDGVRALATRKEQLDRQIEQAEGGPKVAMPPSKEEEMQVASPPQERESNASLLWRAITGKRKQ